jgi:hypothetical protein
MTKIIDDINLSSITPNTKTCFKLNLIENSLGDFWQLPLMVAKGKEGKTLGITAAVHGNELNGIQTIHALWKLIDVKQLSGTVVFLPVVNLPGFINGTREFSDGKDLNRIMPGKKHGSSSSRYVFQLIEKIGNQFDFHFDLHTASEGRINTFYIKSNIDEKPQYELSKILSPEVIVNEKGPKGSFRHTFENMSVPSLTLELGDPNLFQEHHIKPAYIGILKALKKLKFISSLQVDLDLANSTSPLFCEYSKWLYAKQGGILTVHPNLLDRVKKGELIASIKDIFGQKVIDINAKFDGVVIGKSTYPVCAEGSRIAHIGELS